MAVEPEPEPARRWTWSGSRALWPAVAEAVREQNGMVGARWSRGRALGAGGRPPDVAFPEDAAFLKKKAEANRELVLGALRSLTGSASPWPSSCATAAEAPAR